jgi:hypothetical protein
LDLLGFIRPIRGFSMGYGDSKQKIPSLDKLILASGRARRRSMNYQHSMISEFCNKIDK